MKQLQRIARRLLGAAPSADTRLLLDRLERIEVLLSTGGPAQNRGADEGHPETELIRQIADRARGTQAATRRIEGNVQAVVRRLYLSGHLDAPYDLLARRFRILSQNDEDGLTWALFDLIGSTDRRFVELGAGSNGGNSGFLAQDCGWSGLMVEANAGRVARLTERFDTGRVATVQSWITREGVNGLLRTHGLSGDIDLLSIDIDGNDYWVWEALDVVSPRVVVIEFNPAFGSSHTVVVPYNTGFVRGGGAELPHAYYGASLGALTTLAETKGYRLVLVEPSGINAYFLRRDIHPQLPAIAAACAYERSRARMVAAKEGDLDLVATFRAAGLPLVDVTSIARKE